MRTRAIIGNEKGLISPAQLLVVALLPNQSIRLDRTPMRLMRTVITPQHGWGLPNFSELWVFRELLLVFTMRDIKVRYKQTAIGVLWAIVQPFMATVVFTLVL